jgi:tRNA 2-selenouridine synthase SelU
MFDPSAYDLIIDARSPREYTEDHVPGAINLPVVDDDQYAEVGTPIRIAPIRSGSLTRYATWLSIWKASLRLCRAKRGYWCIAFGVANAVDSGAMRWKP